MLVNIMSVALGGSLGSVCRYLVSWSMLGVSSHFPLATLLVNLVGCLGIGVVASWLTGAHPAAEPWRLTIAVGFLGGFTTFSSFGLEMFVMLQSGKILPAVAYLLVSNIVGIIAVAGGWYSGQALLSR